MRSTWMSCSLNTRSTNGSSSPPDRVYGTSTNEWSGSSATPPLVTSRRGADASCAKCALVLVATTSPGSSSHTRDRSRRRWRTTTNPTLTFELEPPRPLCSRLT